MAVITSSTEACAAIEMQASEVLSRTGIYPRRVLMSERQRDAILKAAGLLGVMRRGGRLAALAGLEVVITDDCDLYVPDPSEEERWAAHRPQHEGLFDSR